MVDSHLACEIDVLTAEPPRRRLSNYRKQHESNDRSSDTMMAIESKLQLLTFESSNTSHISYLNEVSRINEGIANRLQNMICIYK